MPADLTQFELAEMLRCSLGLRRAAADAPTLEDAASRMNTFLYDTLRSSTGGERQLVMSRFYKTHPYAALEPPQRTFADALLAGAEPDPGLLCLCLVASTGEEAQWNDRRQSRGHIAIPLTSADYIDQAPMISAMIRQLGFDPAQLVNPQRADLANLAGKTYGVFHVEHAAGSPHIPAQEDFVERYGVKSVVGFGGALPTGDVFAGILFSRVHVTARAADRFRGVALDAKSMLFPYDDSATWAESVAAI